MLLRIVIDLIVFILIVFTVNLFLNLWTLELFSLKLPCLGGDTECIRKQHDEQFVAALKSLPIFLMELGVTYLVDRFIVKRLVKKL